MSEDETSEGDPGNSNDVAPPIAYAPCTSAEEEEEAAAEPAPRRPVVQGIDLTLDNPTDHTLFQLGTLPSGNSSSRSMPPKRTVCYQQREWQQAHFLRKKHYHAHSGAIEIERQWLCFSPSTKKSYLGHSSVTRVTKCSS